MTMITKRDNDLDILAKAVTDDSIELSQELIERKKRLAHIHVLYFSDSFRFHSESELAKVLRKYHGISHFVARRDIEIFKQLYIYSNPVDWKFERALLLYSVKNNINKAREAGDTKTVQREHKNLMDMIGPDKESGDARAININVINYNPILVGGKEIPNLDKVIADMIAKDKAAEEALYTDYEVEK